MPRSIYVSLLVAVMTVMAGPVAATAAARPQDLPTVIDLGPSPGSDALAVSQKGWVVGWAFRFGVTGSEQQAFLWTPKSGMQNLGTLPGGSASSAFAINARGDVVGNSGAPFLWSRGEMTVLPGFEGVGEPRGINDHTHVVGRYFPNHIPPASQHAFTWSSRDGVRDLGVGDALAINKQDQIAGGAGAYPELPVVWDPNSGVRYLDLPADLAQLNGVARGINSLGDAVGTWNGWIKPPPLGPVVGGAALWTADGVRHDLGTLPCAGPGPSSDAFGINDYQEVVGGAYGYGCGTRLSHGFLYRRGVMMDLNWVLPPGIGWTIISANSINNRGEIVGAAMINGEQHAYLMTLPRHHQ